jgi:hypothetical protein
VRYLISTGRCSEFPDAEGLVEFMENRVLFRVDGGDLRMVRRRGSLTDAERVTIDRFYHAIKRLTLAARKAVAA